MSGILTLILVILDLVITINSMPSAAFRSGPFESATVRVGRCKKPTLPIDKNPPVIFNTELYNSSTGTNLLRGNVTILHDCKNKKIKAKAFSWENGKWKMVYLMNNLGCNSILMPILAIATGVDYDQKNCIFFKGKYSFENVDTNKTQHLVSSVQEYGRIMWRNEFFTQTGSAFCWEFETLVTPIGHI